MRQQTNEQKLLEKRKREDSESCYQLVSIMEQKINDQKSNGYISGYKSFYTNCKAFDDMAKKYENQATFKKDDYVDYMYYKYNPETEKIDFKLFHHLKL
jgi:hypothetical protein